MKRYRRRKCKHCGTLYRVNPRRRELQQYCGQPDCQKASHAASHRRWLAKRENRAHFRGPENVDRVRAWRKAHPGYWRRRHKRLVALQDEFPVQPVDITDDATHLIPVALQDVIQLQAPLLVGLISSLTGTTLQDEIAESMRQYQTRGAVILGIVPGMNRQRGEEDGIETCVMSGTGQTGTGSVQLGGSAAGAP